MTHWISPKKWLRPAEIVECTPQVVGELLNDIRALQSALAHVIMRNHTYSDGCSACEEAMKLHNEYIKGDAGNYVCLGLIRQ